MRKNSGEVIALQSKQAVRLDTRDAAIMNILALNSRTPLSQIAGFLRLSTENVRYRYERLRSSNIITDAFAVIKPRALGIHQYVVYVQLKAISQERLRQLIQRVLKHKHVNWVIETGGKWEVVFMIETLHEEKFSSILHEILSPSGQYISDSLVTVITAFEHAPPRYVPGFKAQEEYKNKIQFPYARQFQAPHQTMYLDKADILIAQLLHQNARMSLVDIAKKVGLSADSVHNRIKKLVSAGVVSMFILRLNYHLLGMQYNSIMIKFTTVNRRKEFFAYVKEDVRFFGLLEQLGPWDVSLMMFFASPSELRNFLLDIKEKFSDLISSYETVLLFNQYHFTYLCDGVVEELLEQAKKKVLVTKTFITQ